MAISALNKAQVIFRLFDDMINDSSMSSHKENLEMFREEIIDQLCMSQDTDEKYKCYGVVWEWIIDFLRKQQIELEN